MPIIVEDNRSKLKKRQSYRSQRPDRDLNELKRLRMVRERAGQETNRLTNADIEAVNERLSGTGMKYGGMKKKTKKMKHGGMHKKKKVMKANKGISVDFPLDHPDTEANYKFRKEKSAENCRIG